MVIPFKIGEMSCLAGCIGEMFLRCVSGETMMRAALLIRYQNITRTGVGSRPTILKQIQAEADRATQKSLPAARAVQTLSVLPV
jgi:hypothetical protein